jgi:hypothetical protein
MRTLVLFLLEIEIMTQHLLPSLRLAHRRQMDHHVELAPPLLADLERRTLERLLGALAEGLVEMVDRFFEARRRQVVAVGADEVNGDGPLAHGKTFDFGLDIGAVRCAFCGQWIGCARRRCGRLTGRSGW